MRFITLFAFLFLFATDVVAELQSSQIAIIANADSKNSRAIAAYYAQQRGVPKRQILALKMPTTETISREMWSERIRPQIRKWLEIRKLSDKVDCFVTFIDVPLKIEKAKSDIGTQQSLMYLQKEFDARIKRLDSILEKFHRAGTTDQGIAYLPIDPNSTIEEIQLKIKESVESSQKRTQALPDGDEKTQTLQTIQKLFVQCAGIGTFTKSLSQQLSRSGTSNSGLKTQYDFARGRLASIQEALVAIEMIPPSVERIQTTLALLESSGGIMGTLAWLKSEIDVVEQEETHASFDSELSVVGWDDYALNRWQPNYLNVRYRFSAINAVKKSYMVSRIDGPSLKVARRIVDDAMNVEKEGLKGKAYFDARGLPKKGVPVEPASPTDYDRSVAQIAEWLKTYSNLEVVFDNKTELFQKGDCPDAAIYCGWYSLGNYVDAFDWNRGAVGYHMSESEASTFGTESNVWCKRMLDEGVAATLGPVYEPYTYAFPRPEQFFLLLLSGKYTIAECFAMTNPYNSWTMTLIGDPLYNPYKNAPALDLDALPDELRDFVNGN